MNNIEPIKYESALLAAGGARRRQSAEESPGAEPPPHAADSFRGAGPRSFRKLDLEKAADAVFQASKMPVPEVLWEFDAGHAIQSKPLINRDGSIIVGCRSGEVCAFDPDTGAKRWIFKTEDAQYSAIVSGPPGIVYIPGDGKDRKLHAVDDKTGQQIWEYDLKGEPSTTVTLGSDGTIFIGISIFKPVSKIAAACNEGAAIAIDGKTGKRKWKFKTGNLVVSTPTPGPQGSIYFGGYDSTFYSIDEKTGKKKWEFKADGWISSSPSFSADGKVFFGSWDKKIYALDGKTGKKVWDFATRGDVRGGICTGPDGTLYAGSFDGNLYALDGGTGALKWKRDTGGKVISAPIMDDEGTLYVGNFKGTLSAYDSASGEKKWEFKARGDIEGSPSVRPDGIVYFGTKGGKLYALDSHKLSKIIHELHLDGEGSGKGHEGAQVEIIDDFLVIDGIKLPLGKNVQETPAAHESPPPEPPMPQVKTPQKELTMLFYMNGQYKDIGDNVADALMKLEKAGSDENVSIVAQLGRDPVEPGGQDRDPVDTDWSGVRRYEVIHDDHQENLVPLDALLGLEEKIAGNPLLFYSIGNEYWEKGEKEKAFSYFNKARKLGLLELTSKEGAPPAAKRAAFHEFREAILSTNRDLASSKVFKSPVGEALAESTRMNDPAALEDFVKWGMKKYPSRYYVVVVMGHGFSWKGASGMAVQDMAKAIEKGVADSNNETGSQDRISAVVLNSCSMGNIETAAALKDCTDVTIASQQAADASIFNDWDALVNSLKTDLKNGGSFNTCAFAKGIVQFYRMKNREIKENFPDFFPLKSSYSTLAAVDSGKIPTVVKRCNDFLATCRDNAVKDSKLFRMVRKAKNYPAGAPAPRHMANLYEQMHDLGSIMEQVRENAGMPEAVRKAAEEVMKALADAVIAEQHEEPGMEGSHGLSMWAPESGADVLCQLKEYHREAQAFAEPSGWSTRLLDALNAIPQRTSTAFINSLKRIEELEDALNKSGLDDSQKGALMAQMEAAKEKCGDIREQMKFADRK